MNIPWLGEAELTFDEDRNSYIALCQHENGKNRSNEVTAHYTKKKEI